MRGPGGRGPWFFSRYDGKCSACGEQFDAGQKIRSDGDSGWLCEDCGDG
jgi:DNA-directed RNA polymerase subunit RPC12/RpoP